MSEATIAPEVQMQRQPVEETPTSMRYLGVEVKKAQPRRAAETQPRRFEAIADRELVTFEPDNLQELRDNEGQAPFPSDRVQQQVEWFLEHVSFEDDTGLEYTHEYRYDPATGDIFAVDKANPTSVLLAAHYDTRDGDTPVLTWEGSTRMRATESQEHINLKKESVFSFVDHITFAQDHNAPSETGIVDLASGHVTTDVLTTDNPAIPNREDFAKITDNMQTLEIKKAIALAIRFGEPITLTGGSSLGKSKIGLQMAAELGYEVITINAHGFKTPKELLAQFAHAMQVEPGKKKMLMINEVNSIPSDVLKALNDPLDEYLSNKDINQNLAIIFSENPNKPGYKGVHSLSKDFLRRAPPFRLPEKLSPSDAHFHGMSLIKKTPKHLEGLTESSYLVSRTDPLTVEELDERIPNFEQEWEKKYIYFHNKIQKMLDDEVLDQTVHGESVVFADYVVMAKVLQFVQVFCPDGADSIVPTLQKALTFFYANKLDGENRTKVLAMIKALEDEGGEEPKEDSDRGYTVARADKLWGDNDTDL